MAARYRPIGNIHRATEKELILCNLAIKKSIFKKVGGFKESLYSNEENELLNRIEKAGYQLIYHPWVLAKRPRRKTFSSLLKAFWHYGKGRMEQIKEEGVWSSFLALIPLLFVLYILSLGYFHYWIAFIPLGLYLILALGSALGHAQRHKKIYLVLFLPPIFFMAHLAYAIGLISGLFTDLEKRKKRGRKEKIKAFKIKSFNQEWE
jgi:succinoglycan biosynthesis protein ExoA